MKTKRFSKPDPKRKKKTHFKKDEKKKLEIEEKKLKSEIKDLEKEITDAQTKISTFEKNKQTKEAAMPPQNTKNINIEIAKLISQIATFESKKKSKETKKSDIELKLLIPADPTSMENEDENDKKHEQKDKHRRQEKKRHHRPPSVSHKRPNRNRERRTFSNSFYSQNDLFKSVPKQKQNQKKDQKKNGKEEKKGEKKEDKNKKMNEKKYEKPPSTKELETLPNEMNIKKSNMKMEMEMKEKSANEIYESMKEDRRKLLFISYVEFLIRNHLEGLHYFKIGKKNREDDYVLVSYLIKENSKYVKVWEKQLYKKIDQMIGKNPESYWILELFTGKKYKGSSDTSEEEKEKYQKEFIQKLHDPTFSETFIQQITH